jgi:hypothetical protein
MAKRGDFMGRLSLVKKIPEKKSPAKVEKPKPIEKTAIPPKMGLEKSIAEKLFCIGPDVLLVIGPSGINSKEAGTLTKAGFIVAFHSQNRNTLALKLFNELQKACFKSAYLPKVEREFQELLTAFDAICADIWQKHERLTIDQMRDQIIKRMVQYQTNICNRICLLLI